MELKESKNGSKMRDLHYEKLEAQDYLKELDVNEAKTVFKFRVRMAQFSGNFKGQGPIDPCPLCALHPDVQEECLQCPEVIGKLNIDVQYENIFVSTITRNLARTLEAITKFRNEMSL